MLVDVDPANERSGSQRSPLESIGWRDSTTEIGGRPRICGCPDLARSVVVVVTLFLYVYMRKCKSRDS